MTETMRLRWGAVVAGILLIAGTTALDRTAAFAASPGLPGAIVSEAEGELALRRGVVAALRAKAPRVDPILSERIAASVSRCVREQELAPDLVLAVLMNESSGRPAARSHKGALGLMQVMPHMFEVLALPGSAAHVETNIEAGCRLLADNIRRLGEEHGISAYCWGNNVGNDRYLRRVQALRRDLAPYLEGATEQIQG